MIKARGVSESLACEGETVVVNLHGALISTPGPLRIGMQIDIHVYLTDKHGSAEVVYIHPSQQNYYGIALLKPKNIWGVSLPPDDWQENET